MKPAPAAKAFALLLFTVAALGITGLDLWTKEAVFDLLKVEQTGSPPRVVAQEKHKILERFFWLEANYNYGAFSGWFAEHAEWLAVLSAVALFVILAILIYHLRRKHRPQFLFVLALGLLLGGTLGNLYDRALFGAVRDWIRWFVVYRGKEYVWPNFNIADSAICTGVGLLVFLELRKWRYEVKKSVKSKASQSTQSAM